MVVDRGHQENALLRALVIHDLDDHAQRLDHEKATDDGQHDLVLGADRDGAKRAAQGQRPRVAHEHGRRGCVVPQEPQARAEDAGGEDQKLGRAGHRVDAKVIRDVGRAYDIGDHP